MAANPNWTTRPMDNIRAAQNRVRETMHESCPKLTTLEKSLRQAALRQKARHQVRQYGQRLA